MMRIINNGLSLFCMKTAGMLLWCVLCVALCYSCTGSVSSNLTERMKGEWTVFVPEAFPGFQHYILTVDATNGRIDLQGEQLDIRNTYFPEKNGKLTANIYINGELEKVAIWEEGGELKGITCSTMGNLEWIIKKVEK